MATLNAAKAAKFATESAANLKDWRLNGKGKKFREVAKQALENPEILIGTAQDIANRFPELFGNVPTCVADHNPDDVFYWGILRDFTYESRHKGKTELDFACFGEYRK